MTLKKSVFFLGQNLESMRQKLRLPSCWCGRALRQLCGARSCELLCLSWVILCTLLPLSVFLGDLYRFFQLRDFGSRARATTGTRLPASKCTWGREHAGSLLLSVYPYIACSMVGTGLTKFRPHPQSWCVESPILSSAPPTRPPLRIHSLSSFSLQL